MIRDKRIDTIGCIELLKKELVDGTVEDPGLRSLVKKSMAEKDAAEAEGDLFEAKLLPPGEATFVDPAKFMKLLDGLEISRKDFVACIAVSTTKARELLSAKDLARVSSTEPTAAQLRITRKADTIVAAEKAAKLIMGAVKGN